MQRVDLSFPRSVIFLAFVSDAGLKHDDLYRPIDFQNWLNQKNYDFECSMSIDHNKSYTPDQYREFMRFLMEGYDEKRD